MDEPEPEPIEQPDRRMSVLYALVGVAVLYLGRQIFVPLALAILLTFAVMPLVAWIERGVKRRSLAVLLATLLVTVTLGGAVLFAGQQVVGLAEELPTYRETIVSKIRSVQAGPGGLFGRVAHTLKRIGDDIASKPEDPTAGGGQGAPAPTPLVAPPFAAAPPPSPAAGNLSAAPAATTPPMEWGILTALTEPLASGAIVILLMVMMLMSRENIRDRIIRLAGLQQIGLTTQTLEETGARIGRYLRAQLLVNVIFAVAVSGGLFAIGVPNAILCGVMAGVLRFIPVIGPWLGAIVPAALALAVFDGWYHLIFVILLFGALDIFNNVALEPWLYGSSTGLSSFGVILAIVFWTWVWGPVGLILAVPMTVSVLVFTRHIRHFSSLSILLGDEPVLSESMRFYQRLLCRDEEEAAAILAATPATSDVTEILEQVVVESLVAARADLRRGLITSAQAGRIGVSARELALEWLADRDAGQPAVAAALATPPTGVVCLPVHDALDDAAAAVLTEQLRRDGVGATFIPGALLFSEKIAEAEKTGVRLVVVCTVGPPGELATRRMCKALQQRIPQVPVVVVCKTPAAAGAAGAGGGAVAETAVNQAFTARQVIDRAQSILATAAEGTTAVAGEVRAG